MQNNFYNSEIKTHNPKQPTTINYQMTYYDPLPPSFIQKSILNLQQRLLRRREIDLRIQKSLLEQQNMQKRQKYTSAKNLFGVGYGVERQLEDRLRLLKGRDYGESVARDVQKEQLQQEYKARLKALDRQQEIISQQNIYRRQKQPLSTKDRLYQQSDQYHPLDQSSEMLARKYLNGTRALQFSHQLKKADALSDRRAVSKGKRDFQRHQQPDHSTVKKYMSSSIKKDYNSNEGNSFRAKFIDPTPIKLIENSSSQFNSITSKAQQLEKLNSEVSQLKKEYAKDLRKIQEGKSLDESVILQHKGTKRSGSKSTQLTTQILRVPSSLQQKHPQSIISRPNSSTKNLNQLPIRQHSSKSLRYPQQSTQPPATSQSIQQSVKKKIQNRATISQGVKQALDILATKDITGYLMMIDNKQNKLRKQLREKVLKIPSVKRKFDVGAVAK